MENKTPLIADSEAYVMIDGQTRRVVSRSTYKNRRRLRNAAERRNINYGAHRYFTQLEK